MARFSVGAEEDGEGPSNRPRNRKRPRTNLRVFSLESSMVPGEGERRAQGHEEQQRGEERDLEEEDDDHGQREGGDEEEEEDGGRNTDRAGHNRDGSISMTLLDPEVFDCCICCEPLSVPIFECDNGHIACYSCCTGMRNKCSSCSMPIGYKRCRAMEMVLEAVKVSCQNSVYGCEETFRYASKYRHENECICAPCSCPVSSCSFIGSYKQVCRHFSDNHKNSGICFLYDSTVSITLKENDEFLVLQEGSDGAIFILNNLSEYLGNMVTINCLAPPTPVIGKFFYELQVTSHASILKLQSTAKCTKERFDDVPSEEFLLIPSYFFDPAGQIKLELRIHK